MTPNARCILVVDDNPQDRRLIEELFENGRDDAPRVVGAASGEEALAALDAEPVDCVLLDYMLAGESGADIIARIHTFDHFMPIVMMTGMGSEQVVVEVLQKGACSYLNKADLSVDTLAETIGKAIEDGIARRDAARRETELKRSSRLDALSELAGGLVHDFNNLFTTLDYAIRLSLKANSPKSAHHHLTNALSVLKRGSELTQRLGSFAAHHAVVASARRVGDVLRDFEEMIRPTLRPSIDIAASADDPDALVHCDQSQLEHALINLTVNAREAIQRAGTGRLVRVHVSTLPPLEDGRPAPWLDVTVTDDGPGMSREIAERAADPYFTTKMRGTGTGLGLAMVYGFVHQYGGEFEILSEPERGTAVRMRLPSTGRAVKPIRRGRPAERDPAGASVAARAAPAAPSRRHRLLLVDDEVLLLMEAAEILRDFGYDVAEASSGAEALSMIDPDSPIDLLLTDVQMPGMNGFELAKAARTRLPGLKVLYFSGYTGYSDADMGSVVAPVVTKPCIPQELVDTIRALLDGPADTLVSAGARANLSGRFYAKGGFARPC